MYKICDIHSHIVPNVDDGASDLKMSMQMLHDAYSQGIRSIVCTSHSWGNREKYLKNLKAVIDKARKENIDINLYSGCEIYCNISLVKNIVNALNVGYYPTINKTKYVLVEFDPDTIADEIINCIAYIQENGYYVILAHVERYQNLFTEDKWIVLLQRIGCLFQINAYSLKDERKAGIKSAARKLLKEKVVSFVGSDAHSTIHRPYMIQNGINYICQNCNDEYAQDILYKNAERILNI